MDIRGIDAFAEELGEWIHYAPDKPYREGDEFVCWCPYHENPETSHKPSVTWKPIAKTKTWQLGVFHCFADCGLPSDARKVRRTWKQIQMSNGMRKFSDADLNAISLAPQPEHEPPKGKQKTHKRSLTNKAGKARKQPKISDETWAEYKEILFEDRNLVEWWYEHKGITEDTLRKFDVVWAPSKGCYMFPVYTVDGTLDGYRLYDPFHEDRDKKRWYVTENRSHNQLWGTQQCDHDSESIIIMEGETDLMLAYQDGYHNAVTHTGGAGTWKSDWSNWFTGKIAYICYDPDEAGNKGRDKVSQSLQGIARAVYAIELPAGMDYSEWRSNDHESAEFQGFINDAKELWSDRSGDLPASGIPVKSVSEVKDVTDDNVRSMRVYIAGKAEEPWVAPRDVTISCGQNQGKKCDGCPMFTGSRNEVTSRSFSFSPAQHDSLIAMMNQKDNVKIGLVQDQLSLHCNKIDLDETDRWHIEQISIEDPVDESNGILGDTRYTAYHFYGSGAAKIEQSHDYKLVFRKLADPRTQVLAIAAWNAERTLTDLDNFTITKGIKSQLKQFKPDKPGVHTLAECLDAKYDDLSANVTKIAMRQDLHFMYDLVIHSAASFMYNGMEVKKGMIDAIIVGDTRTGKSETVSKMNAHYHAGAMVSGENSSFAGLVGGVGEIVGSRQKMANWGILPRNHNRMVVIDEVSGLGELLGKMSSVRSEGRAEVNKQGGGEVPAMVRLLWLGNPAPYNRNGDTRMISEYRHGAVSALQELVKAQEDIARFDIAMAVVGDDVSNDEIYGLRSGDISHTYTSEACHSMVMFAWTRKQDQIKFSDEVINAIHKAASRLSAIYVESPPLVQRTNIDTKLARLCASLAIMTYSVEDDGETVVVLPEHVEYIEQFIRQQYDHDRFGYGTVSSVQRKRVERGDENADEMYNYLNTGASAGLPGMPNGIELAEILNALGSDGGSFAVRDLVEMSSDMRMQSVPTKLMNIGMFARKGGRFVLTPTMIQILDMLNEDDGDE
jgi:hypothetical protein